MEMPEEEENPVEQDKPWTSVEEWLAWIAEARGDPIFPDGRE